MIVAHPDFVKEVNLITTLARLWFVFLFFYFFLWLGVLLTINRWINYNKCYYVSKLAINLASCLMSGVQ